MSECKVGGQFSTCMEAMNCSIDLDGQTNRPHIPVAIDSCMGDRCTSAGFVVAEFSKCVDGAKFDSWLPSSVGNNELFARSCAKSLERISGKKYRVVKTQDNRVRSDFWKVIKE